MSEEVSHVEAQPVDKSKIRHIWKIAFYLGAITSVEFIIAFTINAGPAKTFVFIALTIWKAFFIVSEFMHLGHEKKSLVWSIILPTLFIIFLIFILMYQGAAIYEILH